MLIQQSIVFINSLSASCCGRICALLVCLLLFGQIIFYYQARCVRHFICHKRQPINILNIFLKIIDAVGLGNSFNKFLMLPQQIIIFLNFTCSIINSILQCGLVIGNFRIQIAFFAFVFRCNFGAAFLWRISVDN